MKYYFLGIGGVSMSAIAIFLKNDGAQVLGYDERQSYATELLKKHNIDVDFQFNKSHIDEADIIIYSSAFKKENVILQYASSQKKKLFCRGKILGEISNKYEKVVAVAGAHGKTTTVAMIYEILKMSGKNATLHLGGFRAEDGLNFHLGDKEFFVTEACEYCDNFLYLYPFLAVVTNIEKEHMDYFKTFENELNSYKKFKLQSRYVIDSFSKCEAKDISHNSNGGLKFSLFENNVKIMTLNLKICEEVNIQNCIYAYLACKKLGVANCYIKQGLEHFCGVKLRFQKFYCKYFDTVILDYAHHPTEIAKAISSAKKIYKNKNLITVFQPHTYSRTKNLLEDFIAVFKSVSNPLFFKTYSARENIDDGISAKEFTKILQKTNKNAKYFENFNELFAFLQKFSSKDNVLLFVGAGDLPDILHKNNFIS